MVKGYLWSRGICGQGVSVVKGYLWSRGICGQGVSVVKGYLWSRGICGQGVSVVKGYLWSRGICGQGVSVVKGYLWSRGICGQGVSVVKGYLTGCGLNGNSLLKRSIQCCLINVCFLLAYRYLLHVVRVLQLMAGTATTLRIWSHWYSIAYSVILYIFILVMCICVGGL